MEELKPGNLERECMEEKCIRHEFDEIYDVDEYPESQQAKMQKEVDRKWRAKTSACEVDSPCVASNTLECDNIFGGYTCKCKKGWEGKNCEKDINECDTPDWCMNGGTCINTDGGFTCNCTVSWHGERCDYDVDECGCDHTYCFERDEGVWENPCGDYGTCRNTFGSFACKCNDGWTGKLCDQDIDECAESNPCKNSEQICRNTVGSYSFR